MSKKGLKLDHGAAKDAAKKVKSNGKSVANAHKGLPHHGLHALATGQALKRLDGHLKKALGALGQSVEQHGSQLEQSIGAIANQDGQQGSTGGFSGGGSSSGGGGSTGGFSGGGGASAMGAHASFGGSSGYSADSAGTDGPISSGEESGAASIDPGSIDWSGAGSYGSGPEAMSKAVDEALDKLGITDPQARAQWKHGLMIMMEHESSLNAPGAQINTTDSNATRLAGTAADGSPLGCSRGAMQLIPETFTQYHQPGTSTSIYDPVANIAAGINYLRSRYGVSGDAGDLQAKVGQANEGVHQGY